jgi:hypothetical protein
MISHDNQSAKVQITFDGPPAENTGDYNGSGVVDAADYVVWRKGLPSADGTGDGQVNQADYNYWRARFGDLAGTAVAAANVESLNYSAMSTDVGQALPDIGAVERLQYEPRVARSADHSARVWFDLIPVRPAASEMQSNKRHTKLELRDSIMQSQRALLAVLAASTPRGAAPNELEIESHCRNEGRTQDFRALILDAVDAAFDDSGAAENICIPFCTCLRA